MKSFLKTVFLSVILGLIMNVCKPPNESADLIITNANVITVDETAPKAEALAIKGEKIIAVGTANDISKLKSTSTKVIDADGKLVVPGFIDSHAHFIGLGELKVNLDLLEISNWDEAIAMVEEAASKAKPGQWIVGRGWHQDKWDKTPAKNVNGYPTHHSISKISPENPVLLSHASGHAGFANAKAMELAGINAFTQDPEGGKIVRDNKGIPIGVFIEDAELLVYDVYEEYLRKRSPEQVKEDVSKAVKAAEQECLSYGITSFHDAGQSYENIRILKQLAKEGKLNVRLYVMLGEEIDSLRKGIDHRKLIGGGNNFLTVNAIKVLSDGALGSRGAWLLEEYSDMPGHFGLNTTPVEDIEEIAGIAAANGFQLCIHAIGDRANREVLDIFENNYKNNKKDLRWRIEHAQHLNPTEINRIGQIGVLAAMQGVHCTSDAPYVIKRLGENRAKEGAYVWRKLIDLGINVSNGTDAPVERVDPMQCFYSSVTRKTNDGIEFYPEQKMTRMEALRSYTINAAYAAFEENIKGSISVGKLADIVILSDDILSIENEKILDTKVEFTIVGGEIKYHKN